MSRGLAMPRIAMPRIAALLVPLLLGALLCGVTGCKDPRAETRPLPGTTTTKPGYPSSMAALGDSITVAFGACLAPAPCPRSSWATGENTRIDSHYRRISRINPAMSGHAHNLAASRATAADLPDQAAAAASNDVEYVTILIGANDACRSSITGMTPVADFRARIDQTLGILAQRLPKARVLVLSVPNVYRVWQVGHTNKAAVKIWSLGVCPSLLANPTSAAKADVDRRKAFTDRLDAYNEQLSAACAAHRQQCRYDRGAVHRTDFSLNQLNVEDFFHPNAAGQGLLARVSYPERFNW